jgi:hypothetical protein
LSHYEPELHFTHAFQCGFPKPLSAVIRSVDETCGRTDRLVHFVFITYARVKTYTKTDLAVHTEKSERAENRKHAVAITEDSLKLKVREMIEYYGLLSHDWKSD